MAETFPTLHGSSKEKQDETELENSPVEAKENGKMHDPHLAKVREFLSNDPEPDQSEWNDIIIEAERFRTELMARGRIQDSNVPEDTPVETYAAPNLEEVLPLANELIAGLKTKDVSSARKYADEVYQKTKELFL